MENLTSGGSGAETFLLILLITGSCLSIRVTVTSVVSSACLQPMRQNVVTPFFAPSVSIALVQSDRIKYGYSIICFFSFLFLSLSLYQPLVFPDRT
ncbi:hypothetical protein CEXT_707221 [Caerostris extrusa]|uniref:Secreted protein n=1 Tax=Caerostris extrusa TaxID=172846 RepID=A0AAV4R348_CAEEX|nr:hypothetical protein CEXT_707221 [Caerostris extrusa]